MCSYRRFTLSFEVTLPDTVGREDILMTHLKRHCREHALRDGAVDQELIQVCFLSACMASSHHGIVLQVFLAWRHALRHACYSYDVVRCTVT